MTATTSLSDCYSSCPSDQHLKCLEQSTSNFDFSRRWADVFANNTKRWQQFVQTINFSMLQIEPELIDSIRTFQLGEQGEGRTLMALAIQQSEQHNMPDYPLAIQQFIGEEQRHAHYLAEALRANGVEPITEAWSDGLFRRVRKLCGWEVMISVLLSAEVIAIAYYASLASASLDPQAQRLFERILQDEVVHLQFHGGMLNRIRSQRWSGLGHLNWGLHRLFLQMVSLIVWHEHHHVLKTRFSSFHSFALRCDQLLKSAHKN